MDQNNTHALLHWYDAYGRDLPWRVKPTQRSDASTQADPYRVWLSEIMAQQTTLKAVLPYYQTFLNRWSDVRALAQASQNDVLAAWAGLGYYARGRNLHRTAQIVASDYDGQFPNTSKELQALPGIGPYSAAAIAAICYAEPIAVVDGNVERVITRLFAIDTPLPQAKTLVRETVQRALDLPASPARSRPGDFAQALMDFGAMVCTPRAPLCHACPLAEKCRAFHTGDVLRYPLKVPKAPLPVRQGTAVALVFEDPAQGQRYCLFERRHSQRLLHGMLGLPGVGWDQHDDGDVHRLLSRVGLCGVNDYALLPVGRVTHTFTHFRLLLDVVSLYLPFDVTQSLCTSHQLIGLPLERDTLDQLPTVMSKAVQLLISSQSGQPNE